MLQILSIISIGFIIIGLFIYGKSFCSRKKNKYQFENNINYQPEFAFLIPARDESKVIKGLLESIRRQTYPIKMEHVFVIIESLDDPSVKICERFHATVILRSHLENQSKGYALEEAVEWLQNHNQFFDAYFIFDADNILDKNFVTKMNEDYQKGYAISTGYRNFKNGNESVIGASAGLTYCLMNSWRNKNGLKNRKNVMLSGTGFYIHGNYIKKWRTYPFHSLTEDVELSYYATLYGLSTNYNESAIFYDEQPLTYKESVKQRKRWIKGYLTNWINTRPKFRKRLKENPINEGSIRSMMNGISGALWIVFGIILYLITWFFEPMKRLLLQQNYSLTIFLWFLFLLFLIYFSLVLFTYIILEKEGSKLKINHKMRNKVLWFHPIFLISYIHVFLITIFSKNIGWDKMKHES